MNTQTHAAHTPGPYENWESAARIELERAAHYRNEWQIAMARIAQLETALQAIATGGESCKDCSRIARAALAGGV